MTDLIAIVYPSEADAENVRQRLFKMQNEYLLQLGDAVIATKDESGHVKLHQLVSTTAVGAASGSFWGLIIGAIFLNPLLGVAIGAASGAIGGALTDIGINDKFMKGIAEIIQPGNAALFVLADRITSDKVLDDLKGTGGTVLRTTLDRAKEQALRDAVAGSVTTAGASPQAGAVPSVAASPSRM